MDLSQIPVLDNHCHFFSTSFDRRPMHKMLSLSLNEMPDEQLRHSLLYRNMVAGLADVLQTKVSEDELLPAREKLAASNYQGYIKMLMGDVNLQGMLVDIGLQKSAVDFRIFEELVPCTVRYVYRIETVVDRLWKQKIPVSEAVTQFKKQIIAAAEELDVVALKSIIGYRTGLEIDPAVRAEDLCDKSSEAQFRNLFFLEAAELCRELSIPFHVHAAFGESNLDLRTNNPLHLKPFLDSPRAREVKLVLIHGGYPYSFEAGYLAAMYPNVYIDISEIVPFVTLGMRRGVEDIMSMCPLNKLMYGSDGFDLPETHWYGAKAGKKLFAGLLKSLVKQHMIGEDYAEEIAHMVFYRNSMELHGV